MSDEVQGLKVGATASFEKHVTQDDIARFAEVTGDHNPLHSDAAYAARTRFKQPIAHGMLGAGVISAALGTKLAPNSVVIYLGQNLQFRAPVSAGDTITARVTVTKVDVERSRVSLDTLVTKQDGTEVIRGDALIMVEAPR
ncbi:MAG: MaoC family dehydratase [Candidatus Rokubacteria bacterium]|nr:MaoC family dehydratase [Chloroflexota bacterium]MBM4441473.1 MaoC family dehydratase [Candidatus Rokubacteria bacterium]